LDALSAHVPPLGSTQMLPVVGSPDGPGEGVGVGVGLGVGDGVGLGVGDGVGDGVGLGVAQADVLVLPAASARLDALPAAS
jgi:hypothetical protein